LPKGTVYLVNSGNPPSEPIVDIYSDLAIAFTIFAASPNKLHFKVFEGKLGISKLYMPCWEETELLRVIKQYNLSENDFRLLHNLFNGIPRYIFSSSPADIKQSIDNIISTITTTDLLKYIGTDTVNPETSHKIIKLVPDKNYSAYVVHFSSNYVEDRLPQQLAWREREALVNFVLRSSSNIPSAQSLRGVLFEPLAHEKIANGGSFENVIKYAADKNGHEQTEILANIVIPKLEILSVDFTYAQLISTKGPFLIPKDKYVVPKKVNFDLVDSFCWLTDTILISFQLTVGQKHSFDMKKADDIKQRANAQEFRIYYTLPHDKYSSHSLKASSIDNTVKCCKLLIKDLDNS
jgi:hypothetical protein